MTRYLISFDYGAMTFPDEELQDVSDAAHAVVREAKAAGVWVFGGGVLDPEQTSVVDTEGSVRLGAPAKAAHIAGLSIVEVSSREEALEWGAKIAAACRCAQEVREFMHDPES